MTFPAILAGPRRLPAAGRRLRPLPEEARHSAELRPWSAISAISYEAVDPAQLRQYIVTDNDEERPFSRDQRRWVYASSKKENNYFGSGTDNDLEQLAELRGAANMPRSRTYSAHLHGTSSGRSPCAKVLGELARRAQACVPAAPPIVSVSGMSYGSLSAPADGGAKIAGAARIGGRRCHNTGEGGVVALPPQRRRP